VTYLFTYFDGKSELIILDLGSGEEKTVCRLLIDISNKWLAAFSSIDKE
jgi:hypothetical protein